jgi:transcriptional regulator with XRE-family HTH domain
MKAIRQDHRWPNAHVRLKRLYAERVQDGVSQEEFGATHNLGSQGMVWQYLNGYTPLNIEAAAKFAKGLRCTIRDISPEMADELEGEIIPVLGRKIARRVMAMLSAVILAQFLNPSSEAAESRFDITFYTLCFIRRWLRWRPYALTS